MSKNYERIKSVAVYCGSRTPNDHAFEEAAAGLARFIASHGMTLVFGGSNVGTMKTVADAALAEGGKVMGMWMLREKWAQGRSPTGWSSMRLSLPKIWTLF